MSANEDENGEEIPSREIAYRLFAAEYDDASLSYAESDEERAPNYVVSPTGARLNRLFVVGTLTEITSVNDEMLRARVVDPTGAFVVYAGQYQPDELAALEQLEPPEFVAVTGKARTFQPDDSDLVYTSIRPESIAAVDADTRDRWVVSAAEQTVERVGTYAGAAELEATGDALMDALIEGGVESGLAAGIPLAQDHYGTTPDYLEALRDCALEAVEVVAGERDQVAGLSLSPGDSRSDSEATFAALADHAGVAFESLDLEPARTDEADGEPAAATAGAAETEAETEIETDAESGTESLDPGSAAGTATGTDRDATDAAVDADTTDAAVDTDTTDAAVDTDTTDAAVDTDTTDAALEPEADTGVEADAEPPTKSTPETESAAPAAETTESTATETGLTEPETDPSADATEPESAGSTEATAEFDETTDVATTEDDTADADDAAADAGDDDLGDFDADDAGDAGMYEMDEEEREELEEQFGAEFTTGSEVDEPGEAGIDVPDPEPDEEPVAEDELESESEAATEAASTDDGSETAGTDDDLGAPPTSGLEDETEQEPADADEADADDAGDEDEGEDEDEGASADEDPLEDVDLETYVVDRMEELDDGDGADRTALVETVADETGAAEDEIEDAIQDALMGGQCYEPDDETLKAI